MVRGGKSCVTSAGDMKARPVSRFFFGALLLLAGLSSAAGGCSRQTEGERCDTQFGDSDDCESGLVCTACDRLRTLDVDRCCPPEGSAYSDPRCAPTNPGGTCVLAPTEGGGGEGATPSGEAASSSGAAANQGGAGGEPSSSSGGNAGSSQGGAGDTAGSASGSSGGAGDTAAGGGGLPAASGAGGESGADNASGTGGA